MCTRQLRCTRHTGSPPCLQEIHHGANLLFGQDTVSSERRHHSLRVAKGFVGDDGDEIGPIGIFALETHKFGSKRSRIFTTLDDMAGQAIALAAVKGEPPAFSDRRLRLGGTREQGRNGKRRQKQGGLGEKGDQRHFPDVVAMISANIGVEKHKGHRLAMRSTHTG